MKGISYYSAQSGYPDYYEDKRPGDVRLVVLWAQLCGIGIVVLAVWLAGCGMYFLIEKVFG